MWVPREAIFLNGAPGSGKGMNTPNIMQTRGHNNSICVSSLLVRAPPRLGRRRLGNRCTTLTLKTAHPPNHHPTAAQPPPQTNYPDARKFIDAGEMISDAVVGDALLQELLGGGGAAAAGEGEGGSGERQAGHAGVVVDGFPRTAVQVDFLKLLHDKLAALHRLHADGPLSAAFPRPSFKVRRPRRFRSRWVSAEGPG
jgi:adenylate kinase family enzyme